MLIKPFLIALLPVFLLTTSCEKHASKKRFLKINTAEEPVTLDPRKGGDFTSSSLHFMLFETLTKPGKGSELKLGTANKIDLSEDMLTYTFHLRDSKWSDGTPLTAKDYEFSWKSMLEPKFPCPNANLLYFIKNAEKAKKGLVSIDEVAIKAINDKTLEVTLEHPTPFFLNLVCFCVFSPVKHDIVSKNPNWADKISENYITNGPFRLVSWKADNELIVEKNPLYWDESNVILPGIHISVIKDENTAFAMFEKKQLDMLGAITADILPDAVSSLKENKTLHQVSVGQTMFNAFNTQKEPFNNQWIRKALSLAINRDDLVATVAEERGFPAYNLIPPVLKNGVNKQFFEPFNVALANVYLQKGLDQLGMTKDDFKKYTMIYTMGDVHRRLAQTIQSYWRTHLGIEINLQCFDRSYFYTRVNSGDFDICLHFWIAQYNDQLNIFDRFRVQNNPKNFCKWSNERYNQLIDKSYYLTGDARSSLLEEAERIFIEEMPLSPLYHSNRVYALHDNVKGFETSSFGSTHFEKVVVQEN